MKLKIYTLASILLILAVSVYTYVNFGDTIINHKFYTFEIALPLYIWVVVPAILLFIASFFHMVFYGMKLKFEISRWHKDALNLKDMFNALLIAKKKKLHVKNKELKEIADALESAKIKISGDLDTLNSDNSLLENMQMNKTIYEGGYVKLAKSGYDKQSEIIVKNSINRLQSEEDFAKQVIKSKENYAPSVVEKAIVIYAQTMNDKELKTLIDSINKEALTVLIKRIKNGSLQIDAQIAQSLYAKCDESLMFDFVDAVKTQLKPDVTLNLFKSLYETDVNAKEFYIYLLLEFEMTEQAREILVEEEGFEAYKAYLDLIDAGKRYPLTLFIK
jgi:hypothetical protein